jgi:hypothetical protein
LRGALLAIAMSGLVAGATARFAYLLVVRR